MVACAHLFAGNMWGKCDNGTEGLGCGRPETFRNCADVKIVTSTSGLPPQFIHTQPQQHHYSSALRGSDLRIAPQIYYPLVVKYVSPSCHRPPPTRSRRCAAAVSLLFLSFTTRKRTPFHCHPYGKSQKRGNAMRIIT